MHNLNALYNGFETANVHYLSALSLFDRFISGQYFLKMQSQKNSSFDNQKLARVQNSDTKSSTSNVLVRSTKIIHSKTDINDLKIKLIDDNQNAFLALKIVEIIGEDEPHQLDPETIYFITNLLNKMNLKKIRNIVFNSALPLRA